MSLVLHHIVYLLKLFSNRHNSELFSKYHVVWNSRLQEARCEPAFYGDLVYKFRKIDSKTDF